MRVAVTLMLLAAPARATIDMSGDWFVTYHGPPFFAGTRRATFTQTGTALSALGPIGPLTGTIDPDTGVFALAGPGLFCTSHASTLSGTTAADGQSFVGSYSIGFPGHGEDGCFDAGGAAEGVPAGDCGNATLDPGEECDVGPNGDGCCSSLCRATAAGTACDPQETACTRDVCDGAGACVQGPDTDGDGLGDRCDPCTNGGAVSEATARASNFVGPTERVSLRGTVTLPAGTAVDPTITGVVITTWNADQERFRGYNLPAFGWTAGASGRWKFKANTQGQIRAQLKTVGDGVFRLTARGSEGTGLVDTSPPALPLVIIISFNADRVCGDATFAACKFSRTGRTVSCK